MIKHVLRNREELAVRAISHGGLRLGLHQRYRSTTERYYSGIRDFGADRPAGAGNRPAAVVQVQRRDLEGGRTGRHASPRPSNRLSSGCICGTAACTTMRPGRVRFPTGWRQGSTSWWSVMARAAEGGRYRLGAGVFLRIITGVIWTDPRSGAILERMTNHGDQGCISPFDSCRRDWCCRKNPGTGPSCQTCLSEKMPFARGLSPR